MRRFRCEIASRLCLCFGANKYSTAYVSVYKSVTSCIWGQPLSLDTWWSLPFRYVLAIATLARPLQNVTLVCFISDLQREGWFCITYASTTAAFDSSVSALIIEQCLTLVCADHVSAALSVTRVDEVSLVQSDIPVLLTCFVVGQYSSNQAHYIFQL